ncbi:MAG: hypothetical protein ABSF96_10885 [Steroidobacteraceae bacterium]|jgi:hypothetical protein
MKQLSIVAVLFLICASSSAAVLIPPELVGIWATDGSQFRGEALIKGSALYLDTDGIGAMVGGDGVDVLGARIAATAYSQDTHLLNIDVTEYGKVVGSITLTYDPLQETIVSPKDQNRLYHRRLNTLSAAMRKSLGLDPLVNSQVASGQLPKTFQFFYSFEPRGWRYETQISPTQWLEVYETGQRSYFNVLMPDTVDGCTGLRLLKDDKQLEVFIPDNQCAAQYFRFRFVGPDGPKSTWRSVGKMENIAY